MAPASGRHALSDGPRLTGEALRRLLASYRECRTVLAGVRLGVFNALAGREATASETAKRLALPPGNLGVLLDALAAMGLLEKTGQRYRAAPEAERLLADGGAESIAPLARHHDRMWERWSLLEERVRGAAALPDPEADLRDFVGAMAVNARGAAERVVGLLDLSAARSLVDLGGGPGSYAAAFARRWPKLEVTLFDHPGTLEAARGHLEAEGVAGRVRVRGGDIFDGDFGRGYDAIWASNLVHSYGPAEIRRIVAACRRALAPGGRIMVHDFFLEPGHIRPRPAAVFSLHMLVVTGRGRCYTWDEMETFLAAGGFGSMSRLAATEDSGVLTGVRTPG